MMKFESITDVFYQIKTVYFQDSEHSLFKRIRYSHLFLILIKTMPEVMEQSYIIIGSSNEFEIINSDQM
jgi:hypothetical protein